MAKGQDKDRAEFDDPLSDSDVRECSTDELLPHLYRGVQSAHQRIDKLSSDLGTLSNDVHQMRGCLTQLCDDTRAMRDAVVGGAIGNGKKSEQLIASATKIIIALIVMGGLLGGIAIAGGWGVKVNGGRGDSRIEIDGR